MRNLGKYLAIALIVVAIAFWGQPSWPRPALNRTVTNIEFFSQDNVAGTAVLTGKFDVPQSNVAANVGDGLRWKDWHYAKMVEVANWQCKNWNLSPIPYQGEEEIAWIYSGGGGSNWFGILTLKCSDVASVMELVGKGGEEVTKVFYYETSRNLSIPTLDLTGENRRKWRYVVDKTPLQTSP